MISLTDTLMSNNFTSYSIKQILELVQTEDVKVTFGETSERSRVMTIYNDSGIITFEFNSQSSLIYYNDLKKFICKELDFNGAIKKYYF